MSTATDTKAGVRLTLTLASGETYTWTGKKMPAHWKSVLMRQVPYGADVDYRGASWKRERI